MASAIFRKSTSYLKIISLCKKRLLHTCLKNKQKWDLCSAVCLERFPVISAEMNPIEKKFCNLITQIEYENSLHSDHEVKAIEDTEFIKRIQSDEYEETEADAIRVMAKEQEDQWDAELSDFSLASKITEADEKNDYKSLDRKLDRKLTLIVKQKLGNQSHWIFPQCVRQDAQSMRQTAEQRLDELCGTNIKAQIMGNAPCGFLKYKYDKEPSSEDDAVGAKVFFFKAQMQKSPVQEICDEKIEDYLWLTTDELTHYINERLHNESKKIILDL